MLEGQQVYWPGVAMLGTVQRGRISPLTMTEFDPFAAVELRAATGGNAAIAVV